MDTEMKKLQIAVLGSHREDLPKEIYALARDIGSLVAEYNHVLITGASAGVSKSATDGARAKNGVVIAISPRTGSQDKSEFTIDESAATAVVYTGMGYKGRNVISVRSADCVIVVNGGFGTLNEVAIAEGENKPIFSMLGSGGCADALPQIFKDINPKYKKFFGFLNLVELKEAIEKINF
jgi:uncharacterized protein (TIGR00725 family)